jgi:hypothetical protein
MFVFGYFSSANCSTADGVGVAVFFLNAPNKLVFSYAAHVALIAQSDQVFAECGGLGILSQLSIHWQILMNSFLDDHLRISRSQRDGIGIKIATAQPEGEWTER